MGIGGSGQSAVARIAKAQGHEVSGCDLESSRITAQLQKEGISVTVGQHDKSHLKNIDILAHTPAVFYQNITHPEYAEAVKKKIAITWEEFMAKHLMKGKHLIAVSGTHGKGTTTAMLARVLETAGFDPTVEVGANLLDWNRVNYRLGKSKYFLCEADEFMEKFLMYKPYLAIITSVEMDHPEYFKNLDEVVAAFVKFAKKATTVVINGEDKGCQRVIKLIKPIKSIKLIKYKPLTKSQAKLKLPGQHVLADAGAVWAAAKSLGVKESLIKKGLESFSGLERRFEFRGNAPFGAKIYDDYAHHPTAVNVNIKAARELKPKGNIWVIFQPHMHTRLQILFNDFVGALELADRVIVTDVFTRRESNINKPTGKDLALAIGGPKATYVGGELTNVANFISRNAKKDDLILVMGAGDVYKVSDLLLAK